VNTVISGGCFGLASRAPPDHKNRRNVKEMFYYTPVKQQRHIIINLLLVLLLNTLKLWCDCLGGGNLIILNNHTT
jgi:hypothetical protein